MAARDDERDRAGTEEHDALDTERGVFMISVAAELAGMHPQTLRMYEQRGLITPKRSPRNTRLYSQGDVERLRRIQALTSDQGLNLAGVEAVLEMEERMERLERRLERMRKEARAMEERMEEEVERVRRSFRAELVPYEEPGKGLIPAPPRRAVRIPIRRLHRER